MASRDVGEMKPGDPGVEGERDPSMNPSSSLAQDFEEEPLHSEPTSQPVTLTAAVTNSNGGASPLKIPEFESKIATSEPANGIDLLNDVQLHVTIELGRTSMSVEDVLRLGNGSVVELDKLAGDPVDVLVNERLVARGEVLVLNDAFSVRINEIISARSPLELQEAVS